MTMHVETFNSAGQVVKYVNDNSITQDSIQKIEFAGGFWYLLWWA